MPLPNVINHQASLLTVNINEQESVVHPTDRYEIQPLFLDAENGTWVMYAKFPPGTRLPLHFHTGTVHFFTTKGTWHYIEHPEDKQTAGSYLYEPGGSIHQFYVPSDAVEAAEGFMVVSGANVNFDENNQFTDITDAGAIEQAILSVCNEAGRKTPQYVKPGSPATMSRSASADESSS